MPTQIVLKRKRVVNTNCTNLFFYTETKRDHLSPLRPPYQFNNFHRLRYGQLRLVLLLLCLSLSLTSIVPSLLFRFLNLQLLTFKNFNLTAKSLLASPVLSSRKSSFLKLQFRCNYMDSPFFILQLPLCFFAFISCCVLSSEAVPIYGGY